jgi:hypothetical protein
MPIGRHSKARTADQQGLTRRRFLRAAGVGTAGAMAAAGAVMGQAGADVAGAAVPAAAQRIPARRKVVRASGQQTAAAPAAALAVSGPLSFHTIAPQRYLDTRFDGGGPFPRRAASASSSSSTSGIPTTSPPASRTRYLPRRRRSPATSPSPAGPRAGTSAPSGQQRRDPAGLQRELDDRPDRGQLRHRGGGNSRRRRVPGLRRPAQRLDPRQRPRDRRHQRLLHLGDPGRPRATPGSGPP